MKLFIENFRFHKSVKIDFGEESAKVIGASGTGKSTIFDAIEWCLYGVGNKVSSYGTDGKTKVSIEMGKDMIIQRTGKTKIYVWIGNDNYEGESAQKIIDNYFGNNIAFRASSFLPAETQHLLITGTPKEKRELTATFFPESAKHIIYTDKVSAKRKSTSEQKYALDIEIGKLESNMNIMRSTNSWIFDYQMDDLAVHIETDYKQQISDLRNEISQCEKVLGEYTLVTSQLSKLPEENTVIYDSLKDNINKINTQLQGALVAAESKTVKLEMLEKRLNSVSFNEVVESDILLCKSLLKLGSSKVSIGESMANDDLTISKTQPLVDKMQKSLDAIESNKKLKDILECPVCMSKLCYNGTLHTASKEDQGKEMPVEMPDATQSKLKELQFTLDSAKHNIGLKIQLIQEWDTLLQSNPEFDQRLQDSGKSVQEYMMWIEKCIKDNITYKSLQDEKQQVESDTINYMDSNLYQTLSSRLLTYKNDLQNIELNQRQLQDYTSRLDTLVSNNSWLSTGIEHIATLKIKLGELQEIVVNIRKYEEYTKLMNIWKEMETKLSTSRERVKVINNTLETLATIDVILAKTYKQYIDLQLKSLEQDVSRLGKIFFDDTMNISLVSGTESNNGTIRPSFDINIEYRGYQVDPYKDLSTGEKKRLSILLMIALSQSLGSKIMLLDEALSAIDMDNRSIVLDQIEIMDIPCYITSHEDIPGSFTQMVCLDQNPLSK